MFFNRMVLPFPIWFYPPLLDYDVSLYILVDLVVTIPTSPRSSKTKSGCERYVRFRFALSAVFTGPEVPVLRPEFPDPGYIRPKFRPKIPDHVQRASQGVRVAPGGPEIPG